VQFAAKGFPKSRLLRQKTEDKNKVTVTFRSDSHLSQLVISGAITPAIASAITFTRPKRTTRFITEIIDLRG
jgi:hypothetical protein